MNINCLNNILSINHPNTSTLVSNIDNNAENTKKSGLTLPELYQRSAVFIFYFY